MSFPPCEEAALRKRISRRVVGDATTSSGRGPLQELRCVLLNPTQEDWDGAECLLPRALQALNESRGSALCRSGLPPMAGYRHSIARPRRSLHDHPGEHDHHIGFPLVELI
jgi:hypothetical protein